MEEPLFSASSSLAGNLRNSSSISFRPSGGLNATEQEKNRDLLPDSWKFKSVGRQLRHAAKSITKASHSSAALSAHRRYESYHICDSLAQGCVTVSVIHE